MNGVKIMVIDDEKKLVELVGAYLEKEGYSVLAAYDGSEALAMFEKEHPDLVVLDIMLPGLDGYQFCKAVREVSRVPIIMLSAKSGETDRLVGLELGADDYVTKPFSPRELVARIRAVLRRTRPAGGDEPGSRMSSGPLSIDTDRHEVMVGGKDVGMTSTEFSILAALAGSPGRVFSRRQLISMAQGEYYEGYERTVDTHVKNIRKKLKERADDWEFIETVHGVGYKFNAKES